MTAWSSSSSAAELIRTYAPAGLPLLDALDIARAATTDDPTRRTRIEDAARVLGLAR